MAQSAASSASAQRVSLSQVAGKILIAWRTGESRSLQLELENARILTAKARPASTLEMETIEALSGAVESLAERCGKHYGAVRLLEHIAKDERLASC